MIILLIVTFIYQCILNISLLDNRFAPHKNLYRSPQTEKKHQIMMFGWIDVGGRI